MVLPSIREFFLCKYQCFFLCMYFDFDNASGQPDCFELKFKHCLIFHEYTRGVQKVLSLVL